MIMITLSVYFTCFGLTVLWFFLLPGKKGCSEWGMFSFDDG